MLRRQMGLEATPGLIDLAELQRSQSLPWRIRIWQTRSRAISTLAMVEMLPNFATNRLQELIVKASVLQEIS